MLSDQTSRHGFTVLTQPSPTGSAAIDGLRRSPVRREDVAWLGSATWPCEAFGIRGVGRLTHRNGLRRWGLCNRLGLAGMRIVADRGCGAFIWDRKTEALFFWGCGAAHNLR